MWIKILLWLKSHWKTWLIPFLSLAGILIGRLVTGRIPGALAIPKQPPVEPHIEITHKQADKEKEAVGEQAQGEREKVHAQAEQERQAIDAALFNRDRRKTP